MNAALLPDQASVLDLKVMLERARRLDEDAAVRLQAVGDALLVTTGVLARPSTMAMRVLQLAAPAEVDCVVAAASILERLARLQGETGPLELQMPPAQVRAAWAGISAPRSGWKQVAEVAVGELRTAAAAGIEQVAAGVPDVAGSAAVTALRERIWSRPLGEHISAPGALAFAAESMGFLGPDDSAVAGVFANGQWSRLSLQRGHCLSRASLMG